MADIGLAISDVHQINNCLPIASWLISLLPYFFSRHRALTADYPPMNFLVSTHLWVNRFLRSAWHVHCHWYIFFCTVSVRWIFNVMIARPATNVSTSSCCLSVSLNVQIELTPLYLMTISYKYHPYRACMVLRLTVINLISLGDIVPPPKNQIGRRLHQMAPETILTTKMSTFVWHLLQ